MGWGYYYESANSYSEIGRGNFGLRRFKGLSALPERMLSPAASPQERGERLENTKIIAKHTVAVCSKLYLSMEMLQLKT